MEDRKLILLVGPSGAGKTTLGEYLTELGIPEIRSHTMREPRPGESEGKPYFFVSKEEFDTIPFVETTEYPKDSGVYYGTSQGEVYRVLGESSTAYIICDRDGAEQFQAQFPGMCTTVFVYATMQEMVERMQTRGDSENKIRTRIMNAIATHEHSNIDIADYCIINRDLGKAIRTMEFILGELRG